MSSLKKAIAGWFTVTEMMAIESNQKRLPSNYFKALNVKQLKTLSRLHRYRLVTRGIKPINSVIIRGIISKCLETWEKTKGKRLY